jgi:DNA modification methylase
MFGGARVMSHRVIQGDCLEVLRTLPDASVDAVVTDPPYGLSLGNGKDKRRDGRHGLNRPAYSTYDDTPENIAKVVGPALSLALSLAKRGAAFSGPHVHDLPRFSAMGGVYSSAACGRHCWGFKNFSPVLFYGKHPALNKGARPTVLKSNAAAEKNGHPCPKPLEWMLWLVELCTLPGETVLDPFAGSGTTGVACAMLGRNFIGVELSPEYHAIAERRIAEAVAAKEVA